MFQRPQVEGGRLAAAHQQDMTQPQPPAAAGPVVPAADQPLDDHQSGGEAVEQAQHHTGVVVQVHQIEDEDKAQDAPALMMAMRVQRTERPRIRELL